MKKRILQVKWTKRIGLMALLLSAVGIGKIYAYDFSAICETGQTLYYSITDAENHYVALVCPGAANYYSCWYGFTKPTGIIVLPENVQYESDTYAVTSIGSYAFSGCSGLTGSLTIPNSVTTIGNEAFSSCRGLTGSLTIPNSVTTIDDNAFSGCSGLTGSLTIPNSVTMIGGYAFNNCRGLTGSLTIPNSVTTIGGYAFRDCSGLTGSLTIPNSVTTISTAAFSGCSGLTGSLTIPNSVTTIGTAAFYDCSGLTGSLTIPNSVTTIDDYAFRNCSGLTGSLTIPNSVTTIGGFAFENCRGLTGSLTIPNSVTTIGPWAFSNCSGMTGSLTIGNSVTMIGYHAFDGCCNFDAIVVESGNTVYDSRESCNALIKTSTNDLILGCKSSIIPNSVTTISSNAFSDCSGLTGNLTIPNSVIMIGDYAFDNCSGLTGSLTIGNSVTTIGSYAFRNCSGLTGSLIVGNSVTTIGSYAFYNCSGLTGNLTIPNSVTTIGDHAFDNCSGLNGSLTIGDSVTTIGSAAFSNCSGLTGSLTIGNSVTTIGSSAFSDCNGLTGSLTIPNSVTTIDYYAFRNCSGLNGSLTIPNSVTTIGYYTFDNCSGLTGSLTIPNSVTTIGFYAFRNCSGLTGSLTIPNSVTTIGYYAFDNCSGLTGSLTIPNSVTTIGYYAFRNCSGLTGSLTIPNSVTTIGSYAFDNCSGLTGSLTIPNSVTTIGSSAFRGCCNFDSIVVESGNTVYDSRESCNALIKTSTNELILGCKSSIIPNSVTTIGSYAFSNCSGLTGSLTIPNSVTTISDYAFDNCSGLNEIMILGTTPPSLSHDSFTSTNNCPIYVPYETLNDYKTATYWSSYQNRLFPMAYTTIPGYGEDEGNYRFIALPLVENTAPTTVYNMITETAYDLYRFDQSEDLVWRNYEYSENTQDFMLVNGQGYLYANAEDVNIIFKGDFNEDEAKNVELAYNANARFAGWNLVGNPFPVSAYANRSYYKMNEDGTAVEPVAVSMETAIPVCTGVMVKAEITDEFVTFSKTTPAGQPANQGALQIAVTQTNKRGNAIQDKAIVSFNAGDRLEKFVFNKSNASVSIPQGGKELAIACTDKQGEMPLNFKASKNGQYTLSVNSGDVELDYLHLIDNLTGNDINLLTQPNYSFEAKTNDYTSRFRLVFSGIEADGSLTGSGDFAYINNGNIIITGAEASATLQIVDMQGRIIVDTDVSLNITTNGMTSGVYVLRLINGDDYKTQKIVVEQPVFP